MQALSIFPQAAALEGSSVYEVIELLAEYMPESDVELVVGLVPNAFYGYSPETFIDSNETLLQLVDGGEDGEEVPFMPLLVKAREVDVIFAIDAVSFNSLIEITRLADFNVRLQIPTTTGQTVAQ